MATRNESAEFAKRSLKNLHFIVERQVNGDDVHAVTQAITSLLGIIVFPWEDRAIDRVKNKLLPQLVSLGWPKWEMTGRRVIKLGDLVELLRHSIAHWNISFISDSRDPSKEVITFENYPKGQTQTDWSATISGSALILFCDKFTSELLNELE